MQIPSRSKRSKRHPSDGFLVEFVIIPYLSCKVQTGMIVSVGRRIDNGMYRVETLHMPFIISVFGVRKLLLYQLNFVIDDVIAGIEVVEFFAGIGRHFYPLKVENHHLIFFIGLYI